MKALYRSLDPEVVAFVTLQVFFTATFVGLFFVELQSLNAFIDTPAYVAEGRNAAAGRLSGALGAAAEGRTGATVWAALRATAGRAGVPGVSGRRRRSLNGVQAPPPAVSRALRLSGRRRENVQTAAGRLTGAPKGERARWARRGAPGM
jgi:hypothetical protein